MRILHVIHSLNPAHGGTTTAVRVMVEAEARVGATSEIVTLDDAGSPWLRDWPVRVTAVGPGWTNYGWTMRLRRHLQNLTEGVGVMVLHGLWQHHEGVVRSVCRAARIPYLVYPHGMIDPWSIRQTGRKRLLKFASWALKTRRVLRDARGICFTSAGERQAAQSLISTLNVKTYVVPLAVEAPPGTVNALRSAQWILEPSLKERRVVLFLGRLHPKKGCDILIQGFLAWKRAQPDSRAAFHLRLVGPPASTEYRAQLDDLVGSCNANHSDVSFRGLVVGVNKWQELAGAEALVLPSFQENFGLVVGEAMACGRPALLSTRVNIWDWVVDAGAGFADEPTLAGVTRLLNRWEARSSSELDAMSIAALSVYHQRFSATNMTACIRSLYNEIVSR